MNEINKKTNYNILNNNPIENLSETNDFFGTLKKAKAIEFFLSNCFNEIQIENNNEEEEIEENEKIDKNIKMIALYGGWGSGKSSIINYLKKNLNDEKFKTVIFEAWQYEKDKNLPLSMSQCLIDNIEKTDINNIENKIKNIWEGFYGLLIKPLSNITVTVPTGVPPAPLISAKGSDILNSLEQYLKIDYDKLSFHSRLDKFKKSFLTLEKEILGEVTDKRILVFVDDLDRCEPENVIEILSAIKNFYIYGERTIFFCALDKKAVANAIMTKYKEIIKSEEYLEKIFDVSFNMPNISSIKPLLLNYFDNESKIYALNNEKTLIIDELEKFFISLKFTNPRHLKKVLNKYEILTTFKYSDSIDPYYENLVPNILKKNNTYGNFFETILTLFIIILYEFYNDSFIELENYDKKIKSYSDSYYNLNKKHITQYKKESATNTINEIKIDFNNECIFKLFNNIKNLKQNYERLNTINQEHNTNSMDFLEALKNNFLNIFKIISIFTKNSKDEFHIENIDTSYIQNNFLTNKKTHGKTGTLIYEGIFNYMKNFIQQFNENQNEITYLFCIYLLNTLENKTYLIDTTNYTYKIKDLFNMPKELL